MPVFCLCALTAAGLCCRVPTVCCCCLAVAAVSRCSPSHASSNLIIQSKIVIPVGLDTVLKDFTKAVVHQQPGDLVGFAASCVVFALSARLFCTGRRGKNRERANTLACESNYPSIKPSTNQPGTLPNRPSWSACAAQSSRQLCSSSAARIICCAIKTGELLKLAARACSWPQSPI